MFSQREAYPQYLSVIVKCNYNRALAPLSLRLGILRVRFAVRRQLEHRGGRKKSQYQRFPIPAVPFSKN